MRAMRRLGITAGLFSMALLPMAAAVSAEPAAPAAVPVAIAQPIAAFGRVGSAGILPESGLLILVGTGLLGLASIVRRSTRT